jgi:hypothetical protein
MPPNAVKLCRSHRMEEDNRGCGLKIDYHPCDQLWGVFLAALGPRSTRCARGDVPFSPARGGVSALTGDDR